MPQPIEYPLQHQTQLNVGLTENGADIAFICQSQETAGMLHKALSDWGMPQALHAAESNTVVVPVPAQDSPAATVEAVGTTLAQITGFNPAHRYIKEILHSIPAAQEVTAALNPGKREKAPLTTPLTAKAVEKAQSNALEIARGVHPKTLVPNMEKIVDTLHTQASQMVSDGKTAGDLFDVIGSQIKAVPAHPQTERIGTQRAYANGIAQTLGTPNPVNAVQY